MKFKNLYDTMAFAAGGEIGKGRLYALQQALVTTNLIPEKQMNLGVNNASMFIFMLFLSPTSHRGKAMKFAKKSAKEIHGGHPLHAIRILLSEKDQAERVETLSFDRNAGALYLKLKDGSTRAYFTGARLSQKQAEEEIFKFYMKPCKNVVIVEGWFLLQLNEAITEALKEYKQAQSN